LLFAICYLLFAICYLLFAICYLLFAICYLLPDCRSEPDLETTDAECVSHQASEED
jgi:hypothetical protein